MEIYEKPRQLTEKDTLKEGDLFQLGGRELLVRVFNGHSLNREGRVVEVNNWDVDQKTKTEYINWFKQISGNKKSFFIAEEIVPFSGGTGYGRDAIPEVYPVHIHVKAREIGEDYRYNPQAREISFSLTHHETPHLDITNLTLMGHLEKTVSISFS
jgi:hypothetical protein